MKDSRNIQKLLIIVLSVVPLIMVPLLRDYFYLPKLVYIFSIVVFILITHMFAPNSKILPMDNAIRALFIYYTLVSISALLALDPAQALMGMPMRRDGGI